MNIVILSQYFYPEIGAPQNRLLELAKGLIKKGWSVSVITAMPNYPKGKIFNNYKCKFKVKDKIENIDITRYWLYASNSSKSIPRIFSMLSFSFMSLFSLSFIKKNRPDFFFVESPPLTLAFSGYLLSKFSESKLIMNVSDIWPLTAKELGTINDGLLYKCIEKLEKFLYKKSFLCTGQSEEIIQHIKKYECKEVYLFRNGVDVNRFENLKLISKNNKYIKIIYAGLLGVAQGVLSISKNINFKDINAEFHIYGDGAERESLEQFLKENPDRNIFLHKSVNREEIPNLLSQFYCSMIPLVKNIYGAVPSKIYESMAAGLPILFSGAGEGAKIVKENQIGLVSPPMDFEALKKNIVEIKNSIELRNDMAYNCKELAKAKFDRNKLIDMFSDKLRSYVNLCHDDY